METSAQRIWNKINVGVALIKRLKNIFGHEMAFEAIFAVRNWFSSWLTTMTNDKRAHRKQNAIKETPTKAIINNKIRTGPVDVDDSIRFDQYKFTAAAHCRNKTNTYILSAVCVFFLDKNNHSQMRLQHYSCRFKLNQAESINKFYKRTVRAINEWKND